MNPQAKPPARDLGDLSTLISVLYDAAMQGESLDVMLAETCRFCQSNNGAILLFERGNDSNPSGPAQGALSRLATYHDPESVTSADDTDSNTADLPIEQLAAIMRSCMDLNSGKLIPWPEVIKTGYYTDALASNEIWAGSNAIVLEHSLNQTVVAWFSPDPSFGGYSGEHKILFELITPHLQRALLIWSEMRVSNLQYAAGFAALDYLKTGIVIIDDDGEVLFVNAMAERICSSSSGLRLRQNRLSALSRSVDRELQAIIRDTLRCPRNGDTPGSRMISVPPPEKLHAVLVVCIPVSDEYEVVLGARPRAMCFLRDPNASLDVSVESIQSIYGLTPTEALVAASIAEGNTVAECAGQLGHSIHTSRNLLKRAFSKTETHGQAELAALLIKTLPP